MPFAWDLPWTASCSTSSSARRRAAAILGVDADFAAQVAAARAKLPPYQIGRYGQLQEWLEDYEEAVPQHRHTSHLLGLFPFDQITPTTTPELAAAARGHHGTPAERAGLRGRQLGTQQPDLVLRPARGRGHAPYRSLTTLFRVEAENSLFMGTRMLPPLFAYEMDYNTGASAGIAEMLLQSKLGALHLLPALPPAWAERPGQRAVWRAAASRSTWNGGGLADPGEGTFPARRPVPAAFSRTLDGDVRKHACGYGRGGSRGQRIRDSGRGRVRSAASLSILLRPVGANGLFPLPRLLC